MIRIGFTGDFCPWLRVEELLKKDNWENSFSTVIPFFEENDFNIIDLECPLTTGKESIIKTGPHIKAHPECVKLLLTFNCQLVATANNHFKDYGHEGMKETYQTLNKEGINWVGSGLSTKEIRRVASVEVRNKKIAFINVTENEWSTLNDDGYGCNPIDLISVYNDIQQVKDKVDYIIVVAHGGHEHYQLPSPRLKKWYRFFIDAGANVVIGHHTHIISGYEIYKGSPIFYSLGNFCFDWPELRNQPWNKGMLVRLIFEEEKSISFELKYVHQNNHEPGVKIIEGEDEKRIVKEIEKLNKIIADDEEMTKVYQEYIKSQQKIINSRIQPYTSNFLLSLHSRGLLPSLIGTRKKRLLTNLIRCESHRDILVESLKKDIN